MTARSTFYEEQTEQALERLARLRERGAVHGESEQQLVAEILEELSIALHELQVSAQELSDQNEQLVSAEGSIAAERARYQELYDFAPDGYLVTDLYGVIRDANRMAGELLGVDSEVLVGRPLSMYLPVARRRPFRMLCNEMMDAAAAGDSGVRTLETTFMRPDKMLFVASLRVIATRRTEGGDPELRWTLRDLSEQRRTRKALVVETYHRQAAEESLRSSEALYRHLVEHATDLVYTLDEHGRFIYCNEQALHRMLGYSEKELIGRPLTDLVRRDRRKAVRAFTSAQIRHHGGHSYLEFPLLAKDGREVWVGQHGATTAITGGNSRIQAVSRDITTQVAHVEQLERAGERARDYSAHLQTQIEAERARIAREIHDELGAALTVARMELSASPAESATNGECNEQLLRRIDGAIESVRRICSDLRPSLLDNMGLGAAIEWLGQDVQERTHLRCEATVDGLPDELDPDRATALFRIVQEAVTNVIRHASASHVAIRQHMRGNEVVIEIVDDGRGIKPEEQSAHHSYGIAGMHERAKALGGRVRVHGTSKGTQVMVHMPAALPGGGGKVKCVS